MQNRGRKTADNVVPYVTVGLPKWRDAGAMPLFVIARPASPFYLVDGIANENDDANRFASALIEDEEYRARTMTLSGGGKPEVFALLIAVKDSSRLYIPTAGPIPASALYVHDRNFRLGLYLQVEDMPLRHAKTFTVELNRWDTNKVV